MSFGQETVKTLSNIFIERMVESAGMATGLFTIGTFWFYMMNKDPQFRRDIR